MKKLLSVLIIILIVLCQVPLSYAADADQVTLSGLMCVNSDGEQIHSVNKSESYNIVFNAQNKSSEDDVVHIFAAAFSEDGDLIDLFHSYVNIVCSDQYEAYSVPVNASEQNFDYIKVMVWDDNIVPLSKYYLLTKKRIVFSQIDLTPVANGKFYVNPNNSEELLLATYNNSENDNGKYDFAWHNESNQSKVAAVYPLKASDGSEILNSGDGMLYAPSGTPYKMPDRYEGVENKEAVSISYWYSKNVEINIPGDTYSKIHLLLATALIAENRFDVTVRYTDGSSEITEGVPVFSYSNASNQDGFVGYISKKAALNGTDLDNSVGGYVKLALVEYEISVNSKKMVDTVKISATEPSKYTSSSSAGGRNFMIAAVTTEREDSDVNDSVIMSQIDLTPSANGKFYVNPANPDELLLSTYNNSENDNGIHDFTWHNESSGNKVAAVYPLKAADGGEILDSSDGMLHAPSGIVYKMPDRYEGVENKEAISVSYWYSQNTEIDIVNDTYLKLHILVASSLASESRFDVTVKYSDGSSDITDSIPVFSYSNAASQEGFVGYISKKAALNGTDLDNSVGGYVKLALFEHEIDTNPKKKVDTVKISATDPSKYTSSTTAGGRNFMIAAITTETKVFANTDTEKYEQIDLTSAANGKFYVDPSHAEELLLTTYNNESNMGGRHDFTWNNESVGNKVAAVYPLKAADGSEILSSEDGLLHTSSGIPYKMPERYEGVENKEAISLSYWYSGNVEIDLDNDVYTSLHFLIASSLASDSKFDVRIDYTDGSSEIGGNNPVFSYSNAANQNGFVGYISKKAALNGTDLDNSVGGYIKLALFEQEIAVNPNKIVDKIMLYATDPSKYSSSATSGGQTFMISALTTERAFTEDVISYIENKIKTSEYLPQEAQALSDLASAVEQRGVHLSSIDGIARLPQYENDKRDVFVSTTGNDLTGDGSINAPFASVGKACEFIKENDDFIGKWRVVFRGGRYYVNESIELNEQTLPNFSSVTFCGYESEDVVISGAQQIDMTRATAVDSATKALLPTSAANKVVRVDLSSQGIGEAVKPQPAKYGAARSGVSQIIIDNQVYNPARWPNNGYATISSCINNGSDGKGLEFKTNESDSNSSCWSYAEDALINGFFSDNDWRFDIMSMASYDAVTKVIKTADAPFTTIGSTTSPRRFYIENLLEEIDVPGEWYIDENNVLYIYPTNNNANVYITTTNEPLFVISNLSNVYFENICINGNMATAFSFSKARNCEITNCDIKNTASNAVEFSVCENCGIVGCDLSYIGKNAVYVYDGEITLVSMKPRDNYIRDCKISNFATFSRNGNAAGIFLACAHDTVISNNEIFDSVWAAIVMDRPIGTVIEYNDIHDVQKDYGDAGAIYSGKSFVSQGNIIRYNYIHDIEPYSEDIVGELTAVYLDDLSCGFTIHGNIIYRSPIGILLGGGKNNVVSNNIIMNGDVKKAVRTVYADDRGLTWAAQAVQSLVDNLRTYIIYYPKYVAKYSHVTGTYYLESSGTPANNTISNNFYYNAESERIADVYKNGNYNNVYAGNYEYGTNFYDSLLYGSPFVDESRCNFTIKQDSVITKRIPDFENIPFDRIGLINKR